MLTEAKEKAIRRIEKYQRDWNLYAEEVLNVSLDSDQKEILSAIQNNQRVSIRSGHSRGKDFVSALAAICFLTLHKPSKVIMTAPTGRQVSGIMMAEVRRIWKRATIPLGGILMAGGVKMPIDTWYLIGFKASEDNESWTGFHSPNIMVVVTEATGLSDTIFSSIEGVLQNNSKLVLAFNPIKIQGEAYQSTLRDNYKSFKLNCLNAPNVVNYQKFLRGEISYEEYEDRWIPGQVDYNWIKDKLDRTGWAEEVEKPDGVNDFEFDGKYYRPHDLFKKKVLGEFPDEDEDSLITTNMLEKAFERYDSMTEEERDKYINSQKLRVGVDIAGMGRDMNVIIKRAGHLVFDIEVITKSSERIHMEMAGHIVNMEQRYRSLNPQFFIDTIGEGAGVFSRIKEQLNCVVSAKATRKSKHLTDSTKNLTFENMRAYIYWMIREALQNGMAIKRNNQLLEELTQTKYEFTSNGNIKIEDKDKIKERIGRSPDLSDALALSFYPERKIKDSDGSALQNLM